MKKLIKYFFIILICIGGNAHAQTNIWDENPSDSRIEMDSLLNILPYSTGKDKIPLLNRVAEIYWSINPNKTIEYANEALLLSQKFNDKRQEGSTYQSLSRLFIQ